MANKNFDFDQYMYLLSMGCTPANVLAFAKGEYLV